MKNLVLSIIIILLFACQPENKKEVNNNFPQQKKTEILVKYAEGFTIEQYDEYKLLTLKNAWKGDDTSFKYVLYTNKKPKGIEDAVFIKTPIKSIACMSLTHVAFIEKLGLGNSIIALSGCDYVSSSNIIKRISNNSIKEIGHNPQLNYEMLVEEAPDFVMGFGIDASSNSSINKMESLGLTVVLNAEYMETHPLGKAEWIKFIAAFYNKDELATTIFNEVEKEYLNLLELTQNVKQKPTVFTGMPWNGAWYVPGGESFQVQLFKDAGAQYLWVDNEEKRSFVKAKEVIIDEAYEADYWLNQDSYRSVSSIVSFDEKFKGFKSIKQQQLYNNDNRINDKSGNDYWESGVVNPHVVLKDLIKIFHPNLLEHELYYYRKLE